MLSIRASLPLAFFGVSQILSVNVIASSPTATTSSLGPTSTSDDCTTDDFGVAQYNDTASYAVAGDGETLKWNLTAAVALSPSSSSAPAEIKNDFFISFSGDQKNASSSHLAGCMIIYEVPLSDIPVGTTVHNGDCSSFMDPACITAVEAQAQSLVSTSTSNLGGDACEPIIQAINTPPAECVKSNWLNATRAETALDLDYLSEIQACPSYATNHPFGKGILGFGPMIPSDANATYLDQVSESVTPVMIVTYTNGTCSGDTESCSSQASLTCTQPRAPPPGSSQLSPSPSPSPSSGSTVPDKTGAATSRQLGSGIFLEIALVTTAMVFMTL